MPIMAEAHVLVANMKDMLRIVINFGVMTVECFMTTITSWVVDENVRTNVLTNVIVDERP